MGYRRRCSRVILFLLVMGTGSLLWAQGPPYQTDDPVPVDLHHYEFYIFGGVDGTPAEIDSTGPAVEFNWGAIPRVQLHVILPWGGVFPSNNPIYLPGGTGPSAFGLTDMELGVKLALIKETKHIPQIGTFTMFELPTGSYDRGLGVGKVWYKLPLWLQKNYGKWLFDGGGGYQIVSQASYRDFPYTGWLVKRELNERLELGAELFAHGREGFAAAQTGRSAMIDVGGYYHFKHNPNQQFLFCYGHSIAGQTENYAYAGMYWTWGGKDDKGKDDDKKDTARTTGCRGRCGVMEFDDLRRAATVGCPAKESAKMEITLRGLWTLIHGMGFGALYLLACSGALIELYRFTTSSAPVAKRPARSGF